MLDSFRSASKSWVIKLLFGLLILSFLAWGVGDVIRGGLFGRGPAIEVGDRQFTAAEVMSEFKRDIDVLQPQFGGKLTTADARKLGLLDRTIDTIVTRTLIDEAGRKLGLTTADEVVVAKVAAEPSFRNELGQFDRDLLRRALSRAGWSEAEFMRQEKDNILRTQVAEALSGGVTAPQTLTDPLVRWNRESRVADTVTIKASAMAQPATPDAAVLEAYYKANATSFMAPEFRAVTALMLRSADAGRDIQITADMVAEAYKTREDEFHTPERRTVSQIVVVDDASADKAGEMVKAGKDLKVIAKELGVNLIDLGLVEKGDLPDELSGLVFETAVGAVTQPVKTALGFHIAKVISSTPEKIRPLDEVKDQLAKDLLREKSVDRMSELANQVEDSLGGGATLEETAARFQLSVIRIAALDARGLAPNGKPAANIPHSDSFLDVAFHTEQGTESQLTEIDNEGLFLLRVDSVTPPQPKALAEVRADVIAAWQAEQRQAAAKTMADKITDRVKAGETLAKVAQSLSLKLDTTVAFTREGSDAAKLPPDVVSAMFDGKPGTVGAAATRDGWMVAQLDKVVPYDGKTDAKAAEQLRLRTASAISVDLIDQYIAALNAEIGVKVDRSQLAREE
ncbi:peptidyl-prolyl cis-trans isomerase [Magnetospirillum sulfuroxidans]|uniref:Parvulin-like PPIase n=1 Tax=Magnetospirillum sulfuroxidans TaxID=611300 RepID=A0ABS5I962_9PROT|nr:peptidyl-prolyl cis-trans isomerase [Magnetospirillum sulfuroxidans]MBR9970692.1 peptidyl-prolyl cis-trans isomerase [Magnetospirillum sulfuroxidans]